MKRMKDEFLKKVSGGSWDLSTLTPSEWEEYNDLQEDIIGAENTGDWAKVNSLQEKVNAFIARMNEKYGE